MAPVGEVVVLAGVGVVAESGGDVKVPFAGAVGILSGVGSLAEPVENVSGEAGVDRGRVGEQMVEAPVLINDERIDDHGPLVGSRRGLFELDMEVTELLVAVDGGGGVVTTDELVEGCGCDPAGHGRGVTSSVGLQSPANVDIPLTLPLPSGSGSEALVDEVTNGPGHAPRITVGACDPTCRVLVEHGLNAGEPLGCLFGALLELPILLTQ